MTLVKQTRHIFDLSDIKAVRFQCSGCGGELVQTLGDAAIPTNCSSPGCTERWAPENVDTVSHNAALISHANRLVVNPNQQYTIRFEIDGEDQPRS